MSQRRQWARGSPGTRGRFVFRKVLRAFQPRCDGAKSTGDRVVRSEREPGAGARNASVSSLHGPLGAYGPRRARCRDTNSQSVVAAFCAPGHWHGSFNPTCPFSSVQNSGKGMSKVLCC